MGATLVNVACWVGSWEKSGVMGVNELSKYRLLDEPSPFWVSLGLLCACSKQDVTRAKQSFTPNSSVFRPVDSINLIF